MKKIIIGLIALMIISVLIFAFTRNGNDTKAEIKKVPVERGSIVEKALAIGEITPVNEIQVKSKIAGIVHKIYAEVGDKIHTGQALVEIMPDPTPLEITEARRNFEISNVAFEQAKTEFERKKELLNSKLISKQEFEKEKQLFDEAVLKKKLNEERLSLIINGRASDSRDAVESVIKAPISGTVLEKFVNAGDPVVPLTTYQAGTPVYTLADMSELIFRGTIDEIDVGKVHLGMPAQLKIGALPGTEVLGKVSRISPKAKKVENATLFDIEISIDNTNSVELRAGYSANADIIIKNAADVLYVPERLVTFKDDSTYVEVIDTTSGHIEKKLISLGLSDGVNVEIQSGLDKESLVVERPPKVIE